MLVAVAGTGRSPDVARVAAELLEALRSAGVPAAARVIGPLAHGGSLDALAGVGGDPAELAVAGSADRSAAIAELFAATHFHPATPVGIVVLTGGLGWPVATDGDAAAVLGKFRPDQVVLIAEVDDPVNRVGLALDALAGLDVVVLFDGHAAAEDLALIADRAAVTSDVATLAAAVRTKARSS